MNRELNRDRNIKCVFCEAECEEVDASYIVNESIAVCDTHLDIMAEDEF